MKYAATLLLVFTAQAIGGPLGWDSDITQCATRCPDTAKFGYEGGKTYEYQYTSDLKTWVNGASEEHSSLHMAMKVELTVVTPCEFTMRLIDVSLRDSNPGDLNRKDMVEQEFEFQRSLQEHSMRFAFLDGQIESICPTDREQTWVVNIKRGILSALQNTMPSLDSSVRQRETDISGNCPVEYDLEADSWGVKKIRKTKNVLGCTDNHSHLSSFQSTPYTAANSNIQSLPLLKSTHECNQEINKEILISKTECQEKHVFRPFSNGDNGAMTEVSYTLELVEERNAESLPILERLSGRSSLTFDHTPTEAEVEENFRAAQRTLGAICRQTRDDIRPETPGLFAQLVRELRVLDSDSLNTLHQKTSNRQPCAVAERFFHDAIPTLGSPASVRLIRDQILGGHLSELELDVWVTSMAFFPTPTLEMVKDTLPLLQMQPAQSKVVLAVSSLGHSYCRMNPDCGNTREVQEMVRILESYLGSDCRTNGQETHNKVLMTLKALGNLGEAQRATETLARCFTTAEVPMDIRVAAVQAYRRMPCSADRNPLMQTFLNRQEDSEMRINAYLGSMVCPDDMVLSEVKNTLATEEINQVGSFVWTHLTNLQQTSNPHKQAIRAILEDEQIKKVFDLDKRKFSRNLEWSLFSETLNAGGMIDSNLIWSTESFIPRSASMNLTVDMFGHSFNLMEFGGRLEGMDDILEKLFGPEKEMNHVLKRGKRDTISDNEISVLDNMFQKPRPEPQASYFLRVFGNEIRYGDIHGMNVNGLKEKLNFLDWLIELSKEHKYDFTHSLVFLDTTTTIPTGTGFPLRLSVDGTATINMKLSGKVDIRELFSRPSNTDIAVTMEPSGAIEINSEMTVDAFVTRAGLRMRTTLHSSTATSGTITLKNGNNFNVDLNIPQDKIEIISAESKFFVLYRDEERPQTMLTEGALEINKCFSGSLVTAIGMDACVELSLPRMHQSSAPYFPFNAPAKFALSMNKKDTFTSYHFEFNKDIQRVRGSAIRHAFDLTFDTPGSQVDRKITSDFTLDATEGTVAFNMRSPWKKLNAEGAMTNTDVLKKVEGRVTIDESKEYSFIAELPKQSDTYRPNIRLSLPNKRPYTLTGTITYVPWTTFDSEIRIDNIFRSPVIFTTDMDRVVQGNRAKYDATVTLNGGMFTSKVSGQLDDNRGAGVSSGSLSVEHQDSQNKQHHWSVNGKLRQQGNAQRLSYNFDGDWATSTWPRYNGDAKADFQWTPRSMSGNLDTGFAGTRRFILSKSSTYQLSGETKTLESTITAELPALAWKKEVRVNHMHNTNELRHKIILVHNPPHESMFEINLKKESMTPLKMNAEVNLVYPGREVSWVQSIEETSNKVYQHDLSLQLEKYQTIVLTSTYKMEPRHEVSAELTIPQFPPIKFNGHLNPELRDMQARAELDFRYKYAVGTNWRFNGNPNVFDFTHDLEVVYPSRTVTTSASLNRNYARYTALMEALWDATRDQNKKITINADMKLKADSPDIKIKTAWLGDKYFNVDASGAYETEGWLNTKKDAHGQMAIRSNMMRDVSASFRHDWSAQGIESYGEMSLGNMKYTGDYNWKKGAKWYVGEHELSMTTPHQGFRSMKLVTKSMTPGKVDTYHSFEWEDKKMELIIKGSANLKRHMLDGTISFKSPIENFEEMYANMRHTDDGRSFSSNMEVSWARNQNIDAKFNMQHTKQGWSITNNGGLTITTPFEDCRLASLTWEHQNTDALWKCNYEAQKDGSKVTLDVNLGHNKDAVKRTLTGQVMLTTPFQNLRQITLDATHSHELNSLENINTEATIRWNPRAYISYKQELSIRWLELFKMESKLTTPFRALTTASVSLTHQLTGNRFTAEDEIKWGQNQKITLATNVMADLPVLQASVHFTSPFKPIDSINMNINNVKQGGVWKSHADLELMDIETTEIDTEFGYGRNKKLSLNIKSPIPHMKAMAFDGQIKGSLRDFNVRGTLQHHELADKITFVADADTSNINDMQATATFQSPFRTVRNIRAIANHKKQGIKYNTDASLQLPGYRGTAAHEMVVNDWTDFVTSSTVEYKQGKKIELSTEFKMQPGLKGQANLRTPFENFEEITMNVEHQGRLRDFRTSAELSYAPRSKLTSMVTFNMRGNSASASARITTPFGRLSRATLEFNHKGRLTNFKNEAKVEWNRKSIAINNEFAMTDPDVTGSSKITTTFPGFESMSIEFNHNGMLTNFKNDAMVEWNRKSIAINNEFALTAPEVRASSKITTTFQGFESMSFEFNHNGRLANFRNDAKVEWNKKSIAINNEFALTAPDVTASSRITTTFEGFELMSFEFIHNGRLTNFNNGATIAWNRHSIAINNEFALTALEVRASSKITTPFQGFESMSFELNHNGRPTNFKNDAKVAWNRHSIAINNEFALTALEVRASSKITTTFQGFEAMSFELNHNGRLTNFNNDAKVAWNRQSIAINNEFALTAPEVRASSKITTPFRGFESMSFELDHNGRPTNFKNDAKIAWNRQSIAINNEFAMTAPEVRASSKITTTFQGFEAMSFEFNHNGRLTDFKNDAKVAWNRESIAINNEFALDAPDVTASSKITTTFQGFETMSFDLEHTGPAENFNNRLNIDIAGMAIVATSRFEMSYPKMNGALTLQTPFDPVRTVDISFNHDAKKWSNFENSGSLIYNSDTYTGASSFKWFPSSIVATVKVNIPEEYGMEARLRGRQADFTGTGTVTVAGRSSMMDVNHRYDQSGVESGLSLETPYQGYDKFSAGIKHTGTRDNFRQTVNIETPFEGYRRMSGDVSHAGNMRDFRSTGTFETPFASVPRITVEFEHSGDLNKLDSSMAISYTYMGQEKRIAALVSHSIEATKYRTAVTLDMPFQVLSRMTCSVDHNGDSNRFESSVSAGFTSRGVEKTFSGQLTHSKDSVNCHTTVTIQTPFRGISRMSMTADHTHQFTTMDGKVSVTYKRNSFEGDLRYEITDSRYAGAVGVKTPFRNWEATGASFSHENSRRGSETLLQVSTSFPGYDNFKVELDRSGRMKNFRSNVVVETSIDDYRRFELTMSQISTIERVTSNAVLTTSHPDYPRFAFEVNHDHRDLANIKSAGSFETPIRGYESYSYDIMYEQTNPDWKNSDYKAAFSLFTPHTSNFRIDATHSRSSPLKSGKLEITHNAVKYFDMDYDYTVGQKVDMRITMREPRSMEVLMNLEKLANGFNSDSTFKWDTTNRRAQTGIVFNLKNQRDSYSIDRAITVMSRLPTRTIGFTTSYTKQPDTFTHTGTMQFNNGDSNKFSYDVEMNRVTRRSQIMYDGTLSIRSRPYTGKVEVSHNVIPNRQYITEVAIQSYDRLVIKNDLSLNDATFTNELTVQHPKLSRDIQVSITGSLRRGLIEGEFSAQVEQESLSFGGRLSDNGRQKSSSFTLKHPSTQTDLAFIGDFSDDSSQALITASFEYLMALDNQRKIMSTRAEIDKIRKSLDVEVMTPVRSARVVGQMTGTHSFTVAGTSDANSISADVKFDPADRTLDATLKPNPYDAIMVRGQFTEPKAARIEISRQKDGQTINDVALAYDLLSENILTGRAFVRPGITDDIKAYFSGISIDTTELERVAQVLMQEFNLKVSMASRCLRTFDGAEVYMKEAITAPFTEMSTIWRELRRNNEFYIQDMSRTANRYYNTFIRQTTQTFRRLYHNVMVKLQPYTDMAKTKFAEMQTKLKYCSADMARKWEDFKVQANAQFEELRAQFDNAKAQIQPYMNKLKQRVRVYADRLTLKFREFYDKVSNDPRVAEWQSRLATMTPESFVQVLRDARPDLFRKYKLNQAWDRVKNTAIVRTIQDVYTKVYNKAEYLYTTYLKDVLNNLYAGGMDYAKSRVMEKASHLLHLDEDKWTVWDPQGGRYGFQLYVPMDILDKIPRIPQLPELPNIEVGEYVDQVKSFVAQAIPQEMPCLSDLYYRYKPSANARDWVPPFKSRAVVAGPHFMTFDKRFFEYTGQCSYLLARDFIDGTFSVVVNYHRPSNAYTKKSITVITGGHQFEIFPNAKVLLDGNDQAEMPLHMGDTSILRLRNSIRVDNEKGVTIICDLPSDRCTVNVTGWYFAKTGGMLGTYNNEPMDDFMSPSGVIAPSVEQFADSWTVGAKCQLQNYATDVDVSQDSQLYKICAEKFSYKSSPFKRCFAVIDPAPFMRMCINENANSNAILSEKDLCNVAAFYQAECKAEGVPVEKPSVCVQCDKPMNAGMYFEGDVLALSKDDDNVPDSADVVFVVQHSECTEDVVKQLDDMAKGIYKQFKTMGVKEVMFSLVGFGGRNMQSMPHVHTLAGQIFNTYENLAAAARQFDKVGSDDVDVMAAVRFAATLPFRTGVAKSIVLVTCDVKTCTEKSVRYEAVEQLLLQQDIRFHYLMEHNFQTSNKIGLYGVTSDCVHGQKKLKCDLREDAVTPGNLCSELAEISDGSMFDINTWVSGRSKASAKFIKVFSTVVAKKGTPAECQICECAADEDGVGLSLCRRCPEEELPESDVGDVFDVDEDTDEVQNAGNYNLPKVKENRRRQLKTGRGHAKVGKRVAKRPRAGKVAKGKGRQLRSGKVAKRR